jgi:hypothetical protein
MKFVYPEFLWALSALSIPIIIHLFNFRRYKKLYFSSLTFIKQVEQQTRSTERLKNLIILLMRLLALGLIVVAFAQPYIPASNSSENVGNPVLAIYIDNSFSMTAKGTEGELLSEAREMARKLINEASIETRILLNTNNLNGVEQRLLTKVQALEQLDKISISPLIRQVNDVLNWQKRFLDREQLEKEKLGIRQHIIFSDFQEVSSSFQNLKRDDQNFYHPVQLTPQLKGNIYVDSAWFTSPIQRIGQNNELNIRIANAGDENLTNVELHIEVAGIKRDVFIDLPGNQKSNTVVNYTEQGTGIKSGKISVNDKQLLWDDEYYFSYNVKDKISILVLNGKNSNAAVSQVFSLEKYYAVNVVNEGSFTNDRLKGIDLLFINGLNNIPSSLSNTIANFSQSGGSVALFPGENCETNSWNALLRTLNLPSLGPINSNGTKIDKLIYDDPFFQGMFEKKKETISLPSVAKSYQVYDNTNASYLNLIQLQNGMPLFLRSSNATNIFLFTSSLDPSFGSFTSDALFPSIVLRIGEMSQRKTPYALILGQDANYPIYEVSDNETPIHIKNSTIDFIPVTKKIGSLNHLFLGGNEALEKLKNGSFDIVDNDKIGSISLNYDRKESSVKYLDKTAIENGLKNYFKNVAYSEIKDGQSHTKLDISKPFEYWRIALILGFLFLVFEVVIIKLWKS